MFIEERHAAILELLIKNGSITTAQIQERFGISYDSAKRDLRLLEEQGKLRRTHGGAIPLGEPTVGMPRFTAEADAAGDASATVAAYAASLIHEGELIYLPTDPIGQLIARQLPRGIPIRVVTGSVTLADTLRRRENVTVMLAGGEVDSDGRCRDSFACEMIRRLRIDKAFIATEAVTPTFGVSVREARELAFLTAVTEASRRVIGVYPPERIGIDSSISVCAATRLDVLLTCDGIADEARAEFEKRGVSVVMCE